MRDIMCEKRDTVGEKKTKNGSQGSIQCSISKYGTAKEKEVNLNFRVRLGAVFQVSKSEKTLWLLYVQSILTI